MGGRVLFCYSSARVHEPRSRVCSPNRLVQFHFLSKFQLQFECVGRANQGSVPSTPPTVWGGHFVLSSYPSTEQHQLGQYLYLVGGDKVFDINSPESHNSQVWRAKWSDVKQTAAPQHSQPQRGVWTRIADPTTLHPPTVSCGGTLCTVGREADEKLISVYLQHCQKPVSLCRRHVCGELKGQSLCCATQQQHHICCG